MFEASARAIVLASLANKPSGGNVELLVLTLLIHRFDALAIETPQPENFASALTRHAMPSAEIFTPVWPTSLTRIAPAIATLRIGCVAHHTGLL